jgi:two-component system response regulator YesN
MSYLSRIFKQETGHNFVEYLTAMRMEKAVKLLKETDMKSYQVAEAVGIVNPHYFGICFKKWTGMSVSDFKKQ